MRRVVGLALLTLGATVPAARAQGIDLSSGGPVQVTAQGGFEWRENDQEVIATDDARAVRGNVTVLADRLIAHYRKKAGAAATPGAPAQTPPAPAATDSGGALTDADNGDTEVYRLEADGHVRIVTPTDEALSDHAIYDIDQAVLVLTGHALKLTTPQDVLTARDSMEYWSQKHLAIGRGHAKVVTSDGKQVTGDVLVGYTKPDGPPPAVGAAPQPTPVAAKPGTDPLENSAGKLERVEAYGNVEVRTAVDIVRGDRGYYLPDTGLARVFGHVRITHGQNQINGPAADINMKTGIAHMVSLGRDQVQGIIMPNDANSAAAGPAKAGPAKPAVAH